MKKINVYRKVLLDHGYTFNQNTKHLPGINIGEFYVHNSLGSIVLYKRDDSSIYFGHNLKGSALARTNHLKELNQCFKRELRNYELKNILNGKLD